MMNIAGLLSPVHAGQQIHTSADDSAWVAAFGTVEAALAHAQAQLGLIPHEAATDIAAVVDITEFDIDALAIAARGGANPIVAYVKELTAAVEAKATPSARFVHYGCTSQDILDTAAMLIARNILDETVAELASVRDALVEMTARHADTPTAARTLGVHAVPTTFGAKTAVWLRGVDTLITRGHTLIDALPVQLGGAAGTQASYLELARLADATDPAQTVIELVEVFASNMGLQPAEPWHTLRLPIADIASYCTTVTGVLGKTATDLITMSRTEIAEIGEPSGSGKGESSAMPHKRNPALSALILSVAQQVPALGLILQQALAAADERPAGSWHSEWEPLRNILVLTHGAARTTNELLRNIDIYPDAMLDILSATNGQVCSERLSIVITPTLGRSATKKLLQTASFTAHTERRTLLDVLKESPELPVELSPQLDDLTDPENYTGRAADQAQRTAVQGELWYSCR